MPKKLQISVYTAFGQFFDMCEQQLELAADRTIETMMLDERQLSDYQDNLVSGPIELQTCPTVFFDNCDYDVLPIRRTKSCPTGAILDVAESSVESEKLNEMTPAMIGFITNASTDPQSTIGPRTPMARSSLSKLFERIRQVMVEVEQNASIFEKLDQYFVATEVEPTPASIFEKMSDLLDAEEARTPDWIRLKPHSDTTVTTLSSRAVSFCEYCGPNDETDTWASPTSPVKTQWQYLDHPKKCFCFVCFKYTMNLKTWSSFDAPCAPQLPVFVKSPVDSLELYHGKVTRCSSTSSFSTCSVQSTLPPTALSVEPTISELALLREKVEVQRRLIEQLLQLNTVTEKLTKATSTSSL